MTLEERVNLAANLATGQQHLVPSLTQIAGITGVTTWQLHSELKARARLEAQRRAAEQRRWQVQNEAEAVNTEADSIVSEWRRSSPEAREAAFRIISASEIWDALACIV